MAYLGMFLTFLVGIFARPLQDWFVFKINTDQREKQEKEAIIKQAFFYTHAIKGHLAELKTFVACFMTYNKIVDISEELPPGKAEIPDNLLANILTKIAAPDQNAIIELRYILFFKVPGEEFLLRLDKLMNDIHFIKQLSVIRQSQLINPSPDFSKLTEKLAHFDGDPTKAALALASNLSEEAIILIADIENFLKEQK